MPPIIGFKLHKGNSSIKFYIEKENILDQIKKILSKYLMQKNIHYYYRLKKKIGKGGFASVYLVENKAENKLYAAKVFLKQKLITRDKRKAVQNEIENLRGLSHENILKFKEGFITDNSIYMITEYCSGPTLDYYIKKKLLERKEIIKIMN